MGMLAGVFLSVHTPRYCTLEAAFEGKLASEVFRPVRDGLVAQKEQKLVIEISRHIAWIVARAAGETRFQ